MRYLRSTSVPAPYISVTPDACPNVFEEPESNMKSMPPRLDSMTSQFSIPLLIYRISPVKLNVLSFSLETSPITDSDTAKRTVFQRSYSVVASEYDKQHSPSPARVKAVPRRRVHSGDAGNWELLSMTPTPSTMMYYLCLTPTLPVTQRWALPSYDTPLQSCPDWSQHMAHSVRGRGTSSGLSWLLLFSTMIWRVSKWPWGMHWGNLLAECLPWR